MNNKFQIGLFYVSAKKEPILRKYILYIRQFNFEKPNYNSLYTKLKNIT